VAPSAFDVDGQVKKFGIQLTEPEAQEVVAGTEVSSAYLTKSGRLLQLLRTGGAGRVVGVNRGCYANDSPTSTAKGVALQTNLAAEDGEVVGI